MPKTAKKQHYHLIAGEIVFYNPATEAQGVLRLNAIVQTDDNLFGHRQIGQAQQLLQMHFFKHIGDETLQVLDVVLISVSSLGYMTEERFQKPPEGMKLQEAQPQETPPAILKPTPDPFAEMVAAHTAD